MPLMCPRDGRGRECKGQHHEADHPFRHSCAPVWLWVGDCGGVLSPPPCRNLSSSISWRISDRDRGLSCFIGSICSGVNRGSSRMKCTKCQVDCSPAVV